MNNETTEKKQANSYHSVSLGLDLLFIGSLALLITSNIIDGGKVLQLLLAYWPVLLIVSGLKTIIRAQTQRKASGIFIDILFMVAIICTLVFVKELPGTTPQKTETVETIEQKVEATEYTGVTKLAYTISLGATSATITDSDNTNYVTTKGPKNLSIDKALYNGILNLHVANTSSANGYKFSSLRDSVGYDIELGTSKIPTSIDISLGASNAKLTLNQASLDSLTANVGAGELTSDLTGLSIPKQIEVRVGAGKTIFRLHGVQDIKVNYALGAGEVKVSSESGIVAKKFSGLGAKGEFETSPFATTRVNISVGAGSVEVILD